MKQIINVRLGLVLSFGVALCLIGLILPHHISAQTQKSGSIGLEGKISSDPPKSGATITFPRDGATITDLPTTVSGLCPTGLLVKIFKNNVFAGSVRCENGSFSVKIDLFSGRNELVARVYDDLDQPGPDSNIVVANFPYNSIVAPNRISLTSPFAKRGANPKETLTWPIIISGGQSPYAITVDWGDGKPADIISQAFPGTFNISHIYDASGVYNVTIRATDKTGALAFLQLVAVANGPVSQSNAQGKDGGDGSTVTRTKVLWQPAAITIPLIATSFWLGKRYELYVLRKRLENNESIS